MAFLADLGAVIEVTPWDEIGIRTKDSTAFVDDRTSFKFQVSGRLETGQIFYGLHGPIISGPSRYLGLTCNITVRADGSDWRKTRECQASFTIGPSIAIWDQSFDFRHPDGIVVEGFPVIFRFGSISVLDTDERGTLGLLI